ncbi:hypothetical protein Pint_15918 [Pistacia integerrima]|uniref:Uncharacterized protein n=1 Tax=Pistacia integerrima TaxID=434235 RepID=A0ACC0ZAR3_9ROSI|nr:hypothetical protein Pint_15918 [Pistacia integerrima]
MANASGLFTPSVPSFRSGLQPSIRVYRSGFSFSKKILCSTTIQGSENTVSPSESRPPSNALVKKIRDVIVGHGSSDVVFKYLLQDLIVLMVAHLIGKMPEFNH